MVETVVNVLVPIFKVTTSDPEETLNCSKGTVGWKTRARANNKIKTLSRGATFDQEASVPISLGINTGDFTIY